MTQASPWKWPFNAALYSLPQSTKFRIAQSVVLLFCGLIAPSCGLLAQSRVAPSRIDLSNFNQQIRSFLQSEVTAHVADIKSLSIMRTEHPSVLFHESP